MTHIHEAISQDLVNNATIEFDGVRVHEEYVLSAVHERKTRTGEVLKESHIEAGASVLGVARRALEHPWEYAHEHVQGGKPIVEYLAIGHAITGMATKVQATRSLLWTAAEAVEEQADYDHEWGTWSKVFAADVAVDVTERALVEFGGSGIMFDYPVQKYHRDALSFQHSEGPRRATGRTSSATSNAHSVAVTFPIGTHPLVEVGPRRSEPATVHLRTPRGVPNRFGSARSGTEDPPFPVESGLYERDEGIPPCGASLHKSILTGAGRHEGVERRRTSGSGY